MKPKATFIVGLPGSGKSTLAEWLARMSPKTTVFDDLRMGDLEHAREKVQEGNNVVFTHPQLCYSSIRTAARLTVEAWGASPEFIYFENDPAACLANVERRNDGRNVINFIKHASKEYVAPTGSIRVWREGDPDTDYSGTLVFENQ